MNSKSLDKYSALRESWTEKAHSFLKPATSDNIYYVN